VYTEEYGIPKVYLRYTEMESYLKY
jgi:hypothetical protein